MVRKTPLTINIHVGRFAVTGAGFMAAAGWLDVDAAGVAVDADAASAPPERPVATRCGPETDRPFPVADGQVAPLAALLATTAAEERATPPDS